MWCRVDDLYKFLTHWVPSRYGPLGDVSAQGYELIDSDTEWDDEDAKPGVKVACTLYLNIIFISSINFYGQVKL